VKNSLRWVRNSILMGLALVVPVALTAWIVWNIFRLLVTNSFVRLLGAGLAQFFPDVWRDSRSVEALTRGVAVLLLVAALFVLGWATRSYFGRRLYLTGDRLLSRLPMVNRIYLFIRQISEAVMRQRQSLFREVVMVEFPRAGLYSIAFVTTPMPPAMRARFPLAPETDLVTLFVPTTPNPTSGFLVFAPRSQLLPFPGTTADAMKTILSGGNIYPGAADADPPPTLLDLLESWRHPAEGASAPPPAAP